MPRLSFATVLALAVLAPATGCVNLKRTNQSWIPTHKSNLSAAQEFEDSGDFEKAAEIYAKLRKSKPKDPHILHRQGKVLAVQGNYREALDNLKQAQKLSPNNPEILYDYGVICFQVKQFPEAERALKKAGQLDPKGTASFKQLALVQAAQGRYDEAFLSYRHVASEEATRAFIDDLKSKGMEEDPASNSLVADKPSKQLVPNKDRSEADPADEKLLASTSDSEEQSLTKVSSENKTELSLEKPVLSENFSEPADSNPFEASAKTEDQQSLADSTLAPTETRESTTTVELPSVTPKVGPSGNYAELCPQATGEAQALLVTISAGNPQEMKQAIHKLGEMGTVASATVPALLALLDHSDPFVQTHAALALWRVSGDEEQTIPIFLGGMAHPDTGVRSFAATVASVGPQSPHMAEALLKLLPDESPYVQLHAAEALATYSEHQAQATEVVLGHLRDESANTRWLATYLMCDMTPGQPGAVEALAKLLKDPDTRIRISAANALAFQGEAAQSAVPALQENVQDADVKEAAEEALKVIQGTGAEAETSSSEANPFEEPRLSE